MEISTCLCIHALIFVCIYILPCLTKDSGCSQGIHKNRKIKNKPEAEKTYKYRLEQNHKQNVLSNTILCVSPASTQTPGSGNVNSWGVCGNSARTMGKVWNASHQLLMAPSFVKQVKSKWVGQTERTGERGLQNTRQILGRGGRMNRSCDQRLCGTGHMLRCQLREVHLREHYKQVSNGILYPRNPALPGQVMTEHSNQLCAFSY